MNELQIVFDAGNSDIKIMILGDYGHEVVFPHAVVRPSDAEYKKIVKQHELRPVSFDETAIFEYKKTGVIVGTAASKRQHERLLGPAKYTREHLGALFCAGMLQLYPYDHFNISVIVLHPIDVSAENMAALGKSIFGRHIVTLPNRETVTYNVTQVIPMDEPSAVFMTRLLNTDSARYKNQQMALKPDSEVLVLDVGGGLCSFEPVIITRKGEIRTNPLNTPPIQVGIQDVADVFKSEIQSEFYEIAGKIQTLPLKMLHDALATGKITFSNKEYPCEEAANRAMATIANPIAAIYNRSYANGLPYNAIVIGGGGGAIAFDYLWEHVLNHDFVFPAEDDIERMRFSGIRGASKGYAINLQLPKGR